MPRVLVACEFTGTVRDAFAALGCDAWSCDLRPSETPGNHLQCDVREVLGDNWDLMIAHPPCTHLAVSGARWVKDHWVICKSHPDGRYWHDGSWKRQQQREAIRFFMELASADVPRIAIENPVCIMSSEWREPDQIIQPWEHGHGETKATCLWLQGLPLLRPTNIVPGRESRIHRMPPGEEREKERSRTYPGIAKAMASQWSEALARPRPPRQMRMFA